MANDPGAALRALHRPGDPFLLMNAWDVGSARLMAALGAQAIGTTSAGFAFTLGLPDGARITREQALEHAADLAAATPLPVSADLENGYGSAPEDAATAVSRAAEAGAVGGSIEDFHPEDGIYELGHARARIAAAVEAAAGTGFEFTLTARAENHIRGNPDLDDTIARLRAYEEAGADVLYAPGLASPEQIRTVCEAVSKPVNVLALPNLSLEQVFAAGAQRVSLGGSLAWVAVDGLVAAATAIRDHGDLSSLAVSNETNRLLG
ncbi:MAG: isocitrate lyase/phosphoenolpyruvate mutase family protein [Solirubrobacterales bacterium]